MIIYSQIKNKQILLLTSLYFDLENYYLQGSTEQHQLNLISQLCGSIVPDFWPGVENLPLFSTMDLAKNHKRKVKDRLKPYVRDLYACDLIDKMLTLDPTKRIGKC